VKTCDEVRAVASAIDGWLSDAQGCALFRAAAATTGRGLIVEIGSWKGRSTAWLAAGARLAGARVHAIDPHTGSLEDPSARTLEAFRDNLRRAGLETHVEPLVMTSAEAARVLRGGVELLFIDADHTSDGVRADSALWLPRVIEGGTVMFHDVATAGYSGPRRAFRRAVCWSPRFDRIGRVGSMAVARRVARRSPAEAVRGWAAGLALYFFDVQQALRWVTHRIVPASIRASIRARRAA
jgi:predicted O-methyltransferase YrrM